MSHSSTVGFWQTACHWQMTPSVAHQLQTWHQTWNVSSSWCMSQHCQLQQSDAISAVYCSDQNHHNLFETKQRTYFLYNTDICSQKKYVRHSLKIKERIFKSKPTVMVLSHLGSIQWLLDMVWLRAWQQRSIGTVWRRNCLTTDHVHVLGVTFSSDLSLRVPMIWMS